MPTIITIPSKIDLDTLKVIKEEITMIFYTEKGTKQAINHLIDQEISFTVQSKNRKDI